MPTEVGHDMLQLGCADVAISILIKDFEGLFDLLAGGAAHPPGHPVRVREHHLKMKIDQRHAYAHLDGRAKRDYPDIFLIADLAIAIVISLKDNLINLVVGQLFSYRLCDPSE
jgi:hypothetical protein